MPSLTQDELEWPDPGGYVATSARLEAPDAELDPVALAAEHGHLFAGRARTIAGQGAAAVLTLPRGLCDDVALEQVTEWLGAVKHTVPDVSSAPALVAIGAFAFDREASARLVVPRVVWHRTAQGELWRTSLAGPRGARAPRPKPPNRSAPSMISLVAHPEGAQYAHAVAEAVADIKAGLLRKVVLARMVEARFTSAPSPTRILESLWGGDPAFFAFSVPTPEGRLVGASPELLVGRHAHHVVSHAFAGTIARDPQADDAALERLFASSKDRDEHRLVVDEIVRALAPVCDALTVPDAPAVVPLRSDARLGTLIEGRLRSTPGGAGAVLPLLARLHPTPAVAGVCRSEALRRIATLETAPRGYWAGATGWADATGDGEWVLAIRSAFLTGTRALVHAGAGIVAASEPDAELAETTLKLAPVLEALCAGASEVVPR